MAYLMGIDLGTSSLKVLIIDEKGKTFGEAAENYQFDMPVNGYAEQQVDVWWDACCSAVRDCMRSSGLRADEIKCIGLSGQMHGLVSLDENKIPVRPAILHCDARSAKQVKDIERRLGKAEIVRLIQNPINSGFWLPSLLWVRENEPDHYRRIRHIVLPKDYLRYKMTGQLGTDYSDASATLMFDINNMCWSQEVLDAFSIDAAILPEPEESCCVAGRLTADAAICMGVAENTPVIYGGGDQNMQAIGNGVVKEGKSTITIGSSGQICFPISHPVENSDLSCNLFCGYKRNLWIAMGATLNAGMCYKWFNELLDTNDWEELNRLISMVKPGSGGLLFLPYFTGERYLANANLSGGFLGLNYATGKGEMARAVMEGVVYALNDCLKLLQKMGLDAREMIASGGGARSREWLSIQADVLNKPLRLSNTEEQAALGACIAAGVGGGVFSDVEAGCDKLIRYSDVLIEPDEERHQVYNSYHMLFDEAYAAQRDVIEKLTLLGRTEGRR